MQKKIANLPAVQGADRGKQIDEATYQAWKKDKGGLLWSAYDYCWLAAEQQNFLVVRYLLSTGVGHGLLIKVAKEKGKYTKEGLLLIEAGSKLEVCDGEKQNKRTALYFAASENDETLVKAILDKSYEDPERYHAYGEDYLGVKRALSKAEENRNTSIRRMLEAVIRGTYVDQYIQGKADPLRLPAAGQQQEPWEVSVKGMQRVVAYTRTLEGSGTSIRDIFDFNANRLITEVTNENGQGTSTITPLSAVDEDFVSHARDRLHRAGGETNMKLV